MELQKITELQGIVLPDIGIGEIKNTSELAVAEKNQKLLIKTRTEFVNNFKPVKQAIDGLKKQALDFEKTELAKVEKMESENEKYISTYKREIATLQADLKNLVSAYKGIFDKLKFDLSVHSGKMDKVSLEIDRELIQKSKEAAFEKAEKLEKVDQKIETVQQVVVENVQPHQIKQEKVFLKKDEIKGKEVFSISDEKALIEWALQNDRTLLSIQMNKSAVNTWLKNKENQSMPFVKKDIVY